MTDENTSRDSVKDGKDEGLAQLKHELEAANARLGEREKLIQSQHALIQQQRTELEQKQKLKEEMLVFFYLFRPFSLPLVWLVRPIYKLVRPRLGRLNQYAPRKLWLPASYAKKPANSHLPKISIVTPSFNQARFLERTLESVLNQAYPNLEFYIQDGGSTDGTVEMLQRYDGRLSGWASCPDNGQSHAINVAFSRTSGEIMAWLNSDDILLPGALAYVGDYFSRHPEVDVVYGHRLLIDENDREIGRWVMPAHDDQMLSWVDFIPQETMFWRRRIWDQSGGRIDESLHFAIDWDLLVRFRAAGARFARLPRFLGGFRIHPEQKTSAEMPMGFREMCQIWTRTLGRIPSRDELAKAVSFYLLKHVVIDLGWRIRRCVGFQWKLLQRRW